MQKSDALALFRAALKAADPEQAVLGAQLGRSARLLKGRLQVIAVGKAARDMLRGLRRRVAREGGRIARTWVIDTGRGGHPIPTQASVRAAGVIVKAMSDARPGDAWVILISGGASALIGAPRPPLKLRELALSTEKLLGSGASIEEINAIRKHLSLLSGGELLRILAEQVLAGPAIEVLTLALSDVPSNRLDTIGSGPSVLDPTTFKDCLRILRTYGVALPARALTYLKEGARGQRPETVKFVPPGIRARAVIVAGAGASLRSAARVADKKFSVRELGILTGDTRTEARRQARALSGKLLISGGELTVQVKGRGRGGRNQEFVLAALCEFAKRPRDFFVFAAGTDGRDGPTSAAGAFATPATLKRALKLGLDPRGYLAANDSYGFFRKVGGLIVTGPTGTNVMDFRIVYRR